jgi:hypothetical protein
MGSVTQRSYNPEAGMPNGATPLFAATAAAALSIETVSV